MAEREVGKLWGFVPLRLCFFLHEAIRAGLNHVGNGWVCNTILMVFSPKNLLIFTATREL